MDERDEHGETVTTPPAAIPWTQERYHWTSADWRAYFAWAEAMRERSRQDEAA